MPELARTICRESFLPYWPQSCGVPNVRNFWRTQATRRLLTMLRFQTRATLMWLESKIDFLMPSSQSWVDLTTQNLGRIWANHRRSQPYFKFQICCFLSKPERLRSRLRSKTEAQCRTLAPVKITEELREMFESVFSVQPRTKPLIYFWRGAGRPSARIEVRYQKSSAAKKKAFDIRQ